MGYVYILTNKSYKYGWLRRRLLKIGMTQKLPRERARELSVTGIPTPFEVSYYIESERYQEIEKEIHRRLSIYRSEKNREFFKYSIGKAKKLLDKLKYEYLQPSIPKVDDNGRANIRDTNLSLEPLKVIGVGNYTTKFGINGEPYYSAENGFYEAVNAHGMPSAIRPHISIIIDNEELELRSSQEHLESEIDKTNSELTQLELDKSDAEEMIGNIEKEMSVTQQTLDELKAINDLETRISEKIENCNNQEIEFAELEADLKKYPIDDDTVKHRQLTLYPVFGFFCLILSLALYFFYISALDKGFFSSINLENTDMTSYASLNELFDSTAFMRAINKGNIWLLLFPVFPLGLALVIHPIWNSVVKHWEVKNKFAASLSVFGIVIFLILTLFFDSILALKISKKIHESKIIMGLDTGKWTINPIDPLTWDLNIVLVLFCGFFVSVLLSILFHFTLEMWKETRTQNVDDRNKIVRERDRLEAEIRNAKDEIERLSNQLNKAQENIVDLPDLVLITAQIASLKKEALNLENQVEVEKKKIATIQTDIIEKDQQIKNLKERKNKRLIDLVKLRAQIDEFLVGWNKFLASEGNSTEGNSAENSIDTARENAYEIFDRHFQQGGLRWENK